MKEISFLGDSAMDFVSVLFPYNLSVALFALLTMFASFTVLALLEVTNPARRGVTGRPGRITQNFGLGIASIAVGSVLPLSSVTVATIASGQGWGLFQIWPVGWFISLPILLLAKSLLGYVVHWLFHNSPMLWPLHAVHHRDDAVDLSTSFRSHPMAYVMVLVPNALLILALGPDIWPTLIAETILFFAALFQHANVQLPDATSMRLERWLVTPRMHLLHHASERRYHDSNYGEIFSFWDHLFRTFQHQPSTPFTIGVEVSGKQKSVAPSRQ
jgi:sterol desaturase/sphingolipid hydroxylase (fatty acid hydroxylase superfamily)